MDRLGEGKNQKRRQPLSQPSARPVLEVSRVPSPPRGRCRATFAARWSVSRPPVWRETETGAASSLAILLTTVVGVATLDRVVTGVGIQRSRCLVVRGGLPRVPCGPRILSPTHLYGLLREGGARSREPSTLPVRTYYTDSAILSIPPSKYVRDRQTGPPDPLPVTRNGLLTRSKPLHLLAMRQ